MLKRDVSQQQVYRAVFIDTGNELHPYSVETLDLSACLKPRTWKDTHQPTSYPSPQHPPSIIPLA